MSSNQQDSFLTEVFSQYPDRNLLYAHMRDYFDNSCPQSIRDHRFYFSQERRGYGENAFHAMWWLLMRQFKPQKCLEIGIYRGQVISLWALIAKFQNFPCEVHGISPFSPLGDSVSVYLQGIDYLNDVKNSFEHFNLPKPVLIEALSSEPTAVEHVKSIRWDLIYIDGCHDYEAVLADYKLCKNHLTPNGIIVMDDSGLETSFIPSKGLSFAGHPGPSRVVQEFAMKEMFFIGAVGHNSVFQNKQASSLDGGSI